MGEIELNVITSNKLNQLIIILIKPNLSQKPKQMHSGKLTHLYLCSKRYHLLNKHRQEISKPKR